MPTLLAVAASPRGEDSISRTLGQKFIEEWQKSNPDGRVVHRDLCKTKLPFVDVPWMAGSYTPADQHTPEIKEALKISNELIAELKAADRILIATPMYNFSTPAILKAYIDHIVRMGETVSPSYEGLLKDKKTTVIIASSGVYTAGSPTESYNAESSYLKQILGFIGLTDLSIILAGGTAGIAAGKTSKQDLVASFEPAVVAAAQ